MKPVVLRAEDIKGSVIKGDLANLGGGSNLRDEKFVFVSGYFIPEGFVLRYLLTFRTLVIMILVIFVINMKLFRSNYGFHDPLRESLIL